jgi:hypothetical protein
MGRASDPRVQFHRAIENGRLEDAITFARHLPVDMDEAARLVALAGREKSPRFDRLAVRWLTIVLEDRDDLRFDQVRWLLHRLEDLREGRDREAASALRRFIAT